MPIYCSNKINLKEILGENAVVLASMKLNAIMNFFLSYHSYSFISILKVQNCKYFLFNASKGKIQMI